MFKFALGMIETVGLAAAIEAADTGVKSANVKLLGYELTKGGGLVTVKFAGDVGAVKAAVEAGSIAAAKVNKIWSKLVIPRPHDEIEKLINSLETVGNFKETEKIENKDIGIKDDNEVKKVINEEVTEQIKKETEKKTDKDSNGKVEEKINDVSLNKNVKDICNICGDPKCPRKKGEPRILCIHNKK